MPTGYLGSVLSITVKNKQAKLHNCAGKMLNAMQLFTAWKISANIYFFLHKKLWICSAEFCKFYHVTKKLFSKLEKNSQRQRRWLCVITSYSRSTICRGNSNDISARETSTSCLRKLHTPSTFYLISADLLFTKKKLFWFLCRSENEKRFFCVKLRVARGNDNIKLRLKRPFHSSWFSLFKTSANDKIPTVIWWN